MSGLSISKHGALAAAAALVLAGGRAAALEAQTRETASVEAAVRRQINQIRRQEGRPALRPNAALTDAARAYSRRMATEGFFSHTSPSGDTVGDRFRREGVEFYRVGENLFRTSAPLTQVHTRAANWWMNSPSHRQALLRAEFRETGVGVWRSGNRTYVTQLFLLPP